MNPKRWRSISKGPEIGSPISGNSHVGRGAGNLFQDLSVVPQNILAGPLSALSSTRMTRIPCLGVIPSGFGWLLSADRYSPMQHAPICLYRYMYTYYIYVFVHSYSFHIHTYIYTYIRTYIHICTCIRICIICIHICVCVYIYTYLFCLYIYLSMYVLGA